MSVHVRRAASADADAIMALMPRLAAFDVPESRNPVDLWRSDAAMFQRWLDGQAAECFVHVAVDDAQKILGFTLVSLHLEAIAVAEDAEGMGVGQALLAAAESEARAHGALTITLHVFARNARARGFYEKSGYDGELIRYIKELAD